MKSNSIIKSLEKAVPPYYLIVDNMKDELKLYMLMFVMSISVTFFAMLFMFYKGL